MLTRRDFLKKARVGASVAVGLPFLERVLDRDPFDAFRLVFVMPAGDVHAAEADSTRRGVELSIEEASRVGDLLGRRVEWDVYQEGPGLVSTFQNAQPAALIGGFNRKACLDLARTAGEASCLFVNVGCVSDDLRAAECVPAMIHVQASRRMYADAMDIYRESGQAAVDDPVRAVLWHPDLFRYGAAQVNERFARRFGIDMDGPAWAGWMAVKVVWEAATRAANHALPELRAYLADPTTRFDGHKGWPLSFRPEGQLRQPLYLVDASGDVLGEVPQQRDGDDRSARDVLDQLGQGASAGGPPSRCEAKLLK